MSTPETKPPSKAKIRALQLTEQCRLLKLPLPVPEFYFHPTRRWRADLAWPDYKLAVEIEGLVYIRGAIGGRHVTPGGFEDDLEKYAELTLAGFYLIRVLPKWIDRGIAISYIDRFFIEQRGFAHDPRERRDQSIRSAAGAPTRPDR